MSAHEAMILVVALCLSGCMLEAEYSPPQFADEGFVEPDASPGQPAPKLPAEPARVSFDDWVCPEGWSPAPAMVDGDGQALEVEGVEPFDVCLPPQLPEGSAAQLQMKDWDCPQGWNAVPGMADAEGNPLPRDGIEPFTVCEPPGLPEDCPEGFIRRVGTTLCVRLGRPCPDEGEPWATEEAIRARAEGFEGRIWYVQPGVQGGDGSRDLPIGQLDEAAQQAAAGDIAALSTGEHRGAATISTDIAVVGACVAQTSLVSLTPHELEPTLDILVAERALIVDMTVSGPRVGVRVAQPRGALALKGLRVTEAEGVGVVVEGGTGEVVFESIAVDATRARSADQTGGVGLEVSGGATVTLLGSVLTLNHSTGIRVSGANTHITLEDLIVEDTQPQQSDQVGGYGVWVGEGAEVEGRRLVLTGNHHHGVFAEGTGTDILLEDALVSGTRPAAFDDTGGQGVLVTRAAHADLKRLVVAWNRLAGVNIAGEGTQVTIEDLVVRDTQPKAAGLGNGNGLRAEEGASVEVSRLVALRNHTAGLTSRTGSSLSFEDVIVHHTELSQDNFSSGSGLSVRQSASAQGRRLSSMHNHHYGIIVGSSSTANLEDVFVHNTQPTGGGDGGFGIRAESGAQLVLRRACATQNPFAGIWLGNGVRTTLEDIVVQDTIPSSVMNPVSAGLVVGSQVEGSRVLLLGNFPSGFSAQSTAEVSLQQVVIRDTHQLDSPEDEVAGIRLTVEARVSMAQALLLGNETHGVYVRDDAALTLDNTLIAHTKPHAVDGLRGIGVVVKERSSFQATRLHLHHNHSANLLAQGAEVSLLLEDLIVTQTQPRDADKVFGRGLELQDGATMSLRRATFTGNHDRGILLGELTSSFIEDLTIAGTRIQVSDGLQGRGLEMLPRATATLERVALINNYEVGLGLYDAEATIEDLFIASTREQGCAPNCVPLFGTGIVMVGGSLTLADFEIMGNALAGLQLVSPSSFLAQRGVVRSNEIGLNFQGRGEPDLSELFEGVEFLKNGQNYGSEDLIVPAEPVPSSRGQQ